MFKFYRFLPINKSVINRLAILLTTSVTLFALSSSVKNTAQTQTISTNTNNIAFYGTDKESNSMGAEYLLFQDDNNNFARGLVYVQNSDIFSCFNAQYDRQNQSFEKMIFAYPEMGKDEWQKNETAENISLKNFPHQLNYVDVNDNIKQLFNQCLDYFEQN